MLAFNLTRDVLIKAGNADKFSADTEVAPKALIAEKKLMRLRE
jgi:hypothetical protein